MNKKILLFGIGTAVLSACSSWEPDTVEYNNPGSQPGVQEMYEGGAQMDDYYVDIAGWEYRSQWNLANVHDPSVVLAADGYYYMYQTDASYGNSHDPANGGQYRGHFYCRRSKDLVNWQWMGPIMHGMPGWVGEKVNEIRANMGLETSTIDFNDQDKFGYWAPCVRKVNDNLYRLYYSFNMPSADGAAVTDSANVCPNMMGVMETTDPSNVDSWVDKGFVVSQYSDQDLAFEGKGIYGGYYKYNVIDPSYIITPSGENWLIYGSWHSGFSAVQINPETGKTITDLGNPWGAENEAAYGKRVYTRVKSGEGERWQPSEAPEIIYHDGYYYLFMANDELDVAYNTSVVRSQNIDGPYYDINGVNFTEGGPGTGRASQRVPAYPLLTHPYKFGTDHGWVGISHCAVFDDGDGNYYYCSQQRFPANYNGNTASNAIMMGGVRAIIWTSEGWPLVSPERYAGVEQTAISESEIAGKWQHIDLVYNYGNQDASVDITLNSNKTVSGAPFDGQTWSLSGNVLTIGSVKLYLRRDLDWEMKAGERTATIVYAGLSADNKTTYWGKKVQ